MENDRFKIEVLTDEHWQIEDTLTGEFANPVDGTTNVLKGLVKSMNKFYNESEELKTKNRYKNLKKVIEAEDDKKDLYALFYFPCLYTVDDWVSSIEMFSPSYYGALEELYEIIDKFLFGKDASDPSNRMFIYNISW